MESSVEIFKNEQFGEIRTMIIENEPWFVAVDVCRALEIKNNRDAMERLDSDEKSAVGLTDTSSNGVEQKREFTIVNEPGLYSLVLGSRKPEAKEFKRWITHEVIPNIREHGVYMTPAAIKKTLADPDYIIQLATMWKEAEQKAAALAAENQVMKPKAEYFDCLVDRNLLTGIRDTAKEFGIKQNVFVNYLLDNKYLYRNQKGKLTPYAQYVDDGMFTLKEFANKKNGFADTQTLITPKGKETLRLFLQVNPVPTENE